MRTIVTSVAVVSLFSVVAAAQVPSADSSVNQGAARALGVFHGAQFAGGAGDASLAPIPTVADAAPVPDAPAPDSDLPRLTTTAEPGLSLYRKMKALNSLMAQQCSGTDVCRALYGVEEGQFSTFASMYLGTVPAKYTADSDLGDMAYKTVKSFCSNMSSQTISGEITETVFRMVYTANESMQLLQEIQKSAHRSDISQCDLSQTQSSSSSKKRKSS